MQKVSAKVKWLLKIRSPQDLLAWVTTFTTIYCHQWSGLGFTATGESDKQCGAGDGKRVEVKETMRRDWASTSAGRAAEAKPIVVCFRAFALNTTKGLNIHAMPPKNWQ